MAQHFVTVCVVCVLCAAHSPCYAHHPDLPSNSRLITSESANKSTETATNTLITTKFSEHLLITKHNKTVSNNHSKGKDYRTKLSTSLDDNNNKVPAKKITEKDNDEVVDIKQLNLNENLNKIDIVEHKETKEKINEILEKLGQFDDALLNAKSLNKSSYTERPKRHAHHDHHLHHVHRHEPNEKYFTKEIFKMFGNGENMTMDGFERLLKSIGLIQNTKVNKQESHSIDSNQSGNSKNAQINKNKEGANTNINSKHKCLNSSELLSALSEDSTYTSTNSNNINSVLPEWLFERVCPALIYQLTVSNVERSGCLYIPEDYKASETDDYEVEEMSRNMFQVWVYSTVSILIISLCGLLGVAVIPVMGKSYYHQLLQFLVALAVGTLCGDALIHLLPHAMMPNLAHSHEGVTHSNLAANHETLHNENMWKGLVAVLGLVLFFFTEKALNIISEWRKYHKRRKQAQNRVRIMKDPDEGNSNTVGEKLCKHKYTSYPYCYGEITPDTQDHHNREHNHHEKPQTIEEEKPLTSKCNSVSSKIMPNDIVKKNSDDWKLEESALNDAKKITDGSDIPLNETESYTVIIREHEHKHHGHSHSHSHVHSTPDSMSSIAWMVIMGDGLHNFTDGMAIGAAFSANIAGGFSTTIAVFCHELPHELGDFAVLLKAGMSAKQAVFYNLLSSVLCLFGMVFGVLLGTTPDASSWMFAAAAGMFIYIALVDMIPELSSNHSIEKGAHWNCLLQAAGLITGFGIMLIIALYEHDLQHIFSN